MKNTVKIFLSLLITLAMISGTALFSSAATVVESGECGEFVTYELYDNGELIIKGSGDMDDSWCRSLFDNNTDIKKVVINEGVTSIGEEAFCSCSGLTSVTIPSTVTSISMYAFENCEALSAVSIPEGVTSIGAAVFSRCSGLTSVSIPEGVTSLSKNLFSGCSGLTSVSIPDSVTSIGENAFWKCCSLTSVTIPEGVTDIGYGAFCDCTSLTSVNIPEGITSLSQRIFSGCSGLTSVTIPEGVTDIGQEAFFNCSSLCSVNIPSSVTSLQDAVFCGCSSLTSVTIPEGVTDIGQEAFFDCTSLCSVTIPKGVTNIGQAAFGGCTGLTSVTVLSEAGAFTSGVFINSDNISEVHINNLAAWCSIYFYDPLSNPLHNGAKLYINDVEAKDITIPDTVASIEPYAFSGCKNITSVFIPFPLTSIGNSAFGYYFENYGLKKLDNFTIFGIKGSVSEKYAVDNGFDFIEIPPETRPGDADGDGRITAADARHILRASAGLEPQTAELIKTADMDSDSLLTKDDACLILRKSVGLAD